MSPNLELFNKIFNPIRPGVKRFLTKHNQPWFLSNFGLFHHTALYSWHGTRPCSTCTHPDTPTGSHSCQIGNKYSQVRRPEFCFIFPENSTVYQPFHSHTTAHLGPRPLGEFYDYRSHVDMLFRPHLRLRLVFRPKFGKF